MYKITEEEMKIQRALGVASYVKLIKLNPPGLSPTSYRVHVGQYGKIKCKDSFGTISVLFENNVVLRLYSDEVKFI